MAGWVNVVTLSPPYIVSRPASEGCNEASHKSSAPNSLHPAGNHGVGVAERKIFRESNDAKSVRRIGCTIHTPHSRGLVTLIWL